MQVELNMVPRSPPRAARNAASLCAEDADIADFQTSRSTCPSGQADSIKTTRAVALLKMRCRARHTAVGPVSARPLPALLPAPRLAADICDIQR
jgi:hypothetical protein